MLRAAQPHLARDACYGPVLPIPEPQEGQQPLDIHPSLNMRYCFDIADHPIQQELDSRSLREKGSLLLLLARQQLNTRQLCQRVTVFEFQNISVQDRIDPLGVVLLRGPPRRVLGLVGTGCLTACGGAGRKPVR